MRAKHRRHIKSGINYNKYFTLPKNRTVSVVKNATIEDTISEVKNIVATTLPQTEKIAKILKGSNLYITCKNIWEFVYNHIQYEEDRAFFEELREPDRTWADRKGDCDCMSIFVSSILSNLGIAHKLRITKYPKLFPERPRWQHIYIIVPKDGNLNKPLSQKNKNEYITIDCVVDHYNHEVTYLEAKDYDMELVRLNGIDEEELGLVELEMDDELLYATDVNGIGYLGCALSGDLYEYDADLAFGDLGRTRAEKRAWKAEKKRIKALPKSQRREALRQHRENKPRTKAGKLIKKGVHLAMKVNPGAALLRNGILACMKVNLFGVANKLKYGMLTEQEAKAKGLNMQTHARLKKIYNELKHRYKQAGGEEKNLRNAILKGKGNHKDPILRGLEGIDFIGEPEYYSVEGLGEPATASLIAAGTAFVAKYKDIIKKAIGKDGLYNPKALIQKGGKKISGALLNKKQEEEDKKEEANTEGQTEDLNKEIKNISPETPEENLPTITPKQLTALKITAKDASADKILADATGAKEEDFTPPSVSAATNTPTEPKQTGTKDNTLLYLGIGAVALGGLYLATKSNNSNQTVSGTPKRKKRSKSKSKTQKYREVAI
ncbi:MAG: hypothetical protein U0V72_00625 [Cytophagales bacterium]